MVTQGKLIATKTRPPRRVLSIDLTNHGSSPHHALFTYQSMASDVDRTLSAMGITQVDVVGHSMGGKVAMTWALNRPCGSATIQTRGDDGTAVGDAFAVSVRHLCVVDIAPVSYAMSSEAGSSYKVCGMRFVVVAAWIAW